MTVSNSAIPSREEFDLLPPADRRSLFSMLRREFDDKQIRDAWNMKASTFYQMVSRYKNHENNGDEQPQQQQKRRGRPPKNATAQPQPEQVVAESEEQQHEPPVESARSRHTVLDAEYTVIAEDAQEDTKAKIVDADKTVEAAMRGEKHETIGYPFPTIKGTPAQLRKQFEAIALFLEGHEDEHTVFEIRLATVTKG